MGSALIVKDVCWQEQLPLIGKYAVFIGGLLEGVGKCCCAGGLSMKERVKRDKLPVTPLPLILVSNSDGPASMTCSCKISITVPQEESRIKKNHIE
jgi:hypothetical protein